MHGGSSGLTSITATPSGTHIFMARLLDSSVLRSCKRARQQNGSRSSSPKLALVRIRPTASKATSVRAGVRLAMVAPVGCSCDRSDGQAELQPSQAQWVTLDVCADIIYSQSSSRRVCLVATQICCTICHEEAAARSCMVKVPHRKTCSSVKGTIRREAAVSRSRTRKLP